MNTQTDSVVAADHTDLDVINFLLADIGTVVRRRRENTLSDEDFETLMGRSRARLKHLRDQRMVEDLGIELTDAGNAVAQARDLFRQPGVLDLFRRLPGLMTGRELAEKPFARCPDRMPMVGHLGIVK